ncbi:bifunctional 2-dehydro-3-deoxygluconokinase/2-dehydro-3-deoxygalactonokinase [Natronorubrum sp. FCH18a]|uniref:bifunctional 2-dehydro-3-deoxygluconokinase/2-dehydro-3- deoxygalactonokinase n=1 Tax=Natronorubrum sp. FCH18a TaxID=3447018 RepID=UPI003F50E5F6
MSLVTFGETMLRFAPESGERIETATELEFRTAGAESNVAIAASNLGVDAVWTSKLPDSPLGRRVTREVRSHGVEPSVVWSEDGRQGAYYVEDGGEPRGTNVIYDRTDAAVRTTTPEEVFGAIDLAAGDACYVSGITPALSAQLEATTSALFERAQEAGATTVFDLNYRSKLWSPAEARESCEPLLEHVDIFVCAARDARTVLDREGSDESICADLAARYAPDVVVLTQGADGAVAIDGDGSIHDQPAFPAETTDPIGTGDAFVGGFLAASLESADVAGALEYGAATAALKRTLDGDLAVVTPAEVSRVIDETTDGIAR